VEHLDGLERNVLTKVGLGGGKEGEHKFDLTGDKVLVECKAYLKARDGSPDSAKLANWNMAMYYFTLAGPAFKQKYFFVLSPPSTKKKDKQTLLEYYLERFGYLIPQDVVLYEWTPKTWGDDRGAVTAKYRKGKPF
jgi:hypothetical protein